MFKQRVAIFQSVQAVGKVPTAILVSNLNTHILFEKLFSMK